MAERVLLVDDYGPWRQQVISELRKQPRWQVIDEAADGAEAVQKAKSLKPDLILLDIGLPTLSGIEAARRILASDPGLKILFVSEHRSWDVAEAALNTGARGYMIKSDAARELLPAMEAIANGKRFISARLAGRMLDQFSNPEHAANTSRSHEVGFYSDDTILLDDFASFAATALGIGNALIVVSSDAHRRGLDHRLRARGLDVDGAVKEGRYVSMNVPEAISGFMVDGLPDEEQFWKAGISLVMRAASSLKEHDRRVSACGDCAPTLLREGKVEAAIQLERLWDELARTLDVDVFCGYSTMVPGLEDSSIFQKICAEHSKVHSH